MAQAVDAAGYGRDEFDAMLAQIEEEKIVAQAVNIFKIFPDVSQPRRAVPSFLRTLDMPRLFESWLDAVHQERGEDYAFPLAELLMDGTDYVVNNDDFHAAPSGPVESAFLQIVTLAASIRRDGLANPITVVETGDRYRLETGERRWLAYHLLFWFLQDEKWSKIPARSVPQLNVWRQAAENAARANLNAIGKARQYAVLMMALYTEQGKQFQSLTTFPHERHYYAQALAFSAAPYGKRDLLLSAMGLQSPAELTRCRQLLGLPDRVWTMADDCDIQQSVLLQCVQLPEAKAIAKLERIVSSWNDSKYPKSKKPPTPPAEQTPVDKFQRAYKPLQKRLTSILASAGQGDRNQIADWLEAEARRIRQGE